MNKRGQFYLIAAFVIITIILGFFATSNYINKKEVVKVYDLKEELGIESGEVIQYGTYNQDDNDMNILLEEFTEDYSQYAGDDKNIYYIIGNREKIKVLTYNQIESGSVTIGLGGSSSVLTLTEGVINKDEIETRGEKEVTIKIKDPETNEEIDYLFELKQGENFYFIISQKIGGNQFVATN